MLGAHGLAATFAHLPIVQGGVRCECGQRGCLATVASPALVLERAGLEDFAAAHGQQAALAELVARVGDADDRARWSWLDAALWIGRALQVVVPTIDPAVVVIGGYWASLVGDIETSFRSIGRRSLAVRSSRSRQWRRRASAPMRHSSAPGARLASVSSPSRCCSPASGWMLICRSRSRSGATPTRASTSRMRP